MTFIYHKIKKLAIIVVFHFVQILRVTTIKQMKISRIVRVVRVVEACPWLIFYFKAGKMDGKLWPLKRKFCKVVEDK
jgi:hypothetical protein